MVSSLPGSLEGPASPSLCRACTHLPQAWMCSGHCRAHVQSSKAFRSSCRKPQSLSLVGICGALNAAGRQRSLCIHWFRSKDGHLFSIYPSYRAPVLVESWCLGCTWALLALAWLFGFIGVHHCRKKCMFILVGNSSWMLSQVSIIKKKKRSQYCTATVLLWHYSRANGIMLGKITSKFAINIEKPLFHEFQFDLESHKYI